MELPRKIDTLQKAQQIKIASERVFAIALLQRSPHVEMIHEPGLVEIPGLGCTYPDFFVTNLLVADARGSMIEVTQSRNDDLGKRKWRQLEILSLSGFRYVLMDRELLEDFLKDTIENFDLKFGGVRGAMTRARETPKGQSRFTIAK